MPSGDSSSYRALPSDLSAAPPDASPPAPAVPSVTSDEVRRFVLLPETVLWLERYLEKRLPKQDCEDVGQQVMMRAIESRRGPENEAKLRSWYRGVADHTIADHFRKRGVIDSHETSFDEMPHVPTDAAIERHAKDVLLPWITWKTRGDATERKIVAILKEKANSGETYEEVAKRHGMTLAALTSAMFRMKSKHGPAWKRQKLMLGVALLVIVLCALAVAARRILFPPQPTPEPVLPWKPAPMATAVDVPFEPAVPTSPGVEAETLRAEAQKACDAKAWAECNDKLDLAQKRDPASNQDPRVVAMRARIHQAGNDAMRKGP